jgi:hypothetical protein
VAGLGPEDPADLRGVGEDAITLAGVDVGAVLAAGVELLAPLVVHPAAVRHAIRDDPPVKEVRVDAPEARVIERYELGHRAAAS